MNKIFFIGINTVTLPLVEFVQEKGEVHVSNCAHIASQKSKFIYHKTEHSFFGFDTLIGKVFDTQISLPYYQKGLSSILNKVKPDIVVCMDFFRFWFLQALWYKIKNPKTILVIHSETKITPSSLMSKLLFFPMLWVARIYTSHINTIITYSGLGQTYLQRLFNRKIALCPVPIKPGIFYQKDDRKFFTKNHLQILMVSRFVPYKRHIDTLQAIKILIDDGIEVNATFVGSKTAYVQEIKSLADSLNIQDRILFVESKSPEELNHMYNTHDVLLLTSYNDAIGIVVVEALTSGLPCIVSDTSGAATYIVNGENGYTYKTSDVSELVKTIKSIARTDTLMYMSERAKHIMTEQFNFDKMGLLFYDTISKK